MPARAGAQSASLFERMGGLPRISAIVNETTDAIARDPTLNQSYQGLNIAHLKAGLTRYLCSLTGGDCAYAGDDIKTIHAGLRISEAEMNGFVAAMRAAMAHQGIGEREKNELLAMLAPMRQYVVTR